MTPWQELAQVAKQRDGQGRRKLAVVVGSGLNVQAGVRDSWLALLQTIAEEADIHASSKTRLLRLLAETGGSGMTSIWEAFLCALAGPPGAAHQVENSLKQAVSRLLRVTHERRAADLDFFREFAELGFADILSLNFDRSLLIASSGSDVQGESSLDRHGEAASSRVWFPHGDTKRSSTIRLGVRSYGVYIAQLEQAFRAFKAARRVTAPTPGTRGATARTREPRNWLEAALSQPLLFVGCGLSTDEWPLWWMLHQRARNQARTPSAARLPCFFMCAGAASSIAPHLRAEPAGLSLMRADTHQEAWQQLKHALS